MKGLRKRFIAFYDAFLSLKGSPRFLASSFSVGLVVGLFPLVGLHIVLCAAVSLLIRLNMIAMYSASWLVCNPLTFVPVIVAEYQIGRLLLSRPSVYLPEEWSFKIMINLGGEVLGPLLLGWVVLSALMAPLGHLVVRAMVAKARRAEEAS